MPRSAFAILIPFASSALLAQNVNIPLTNWTVPPYTIHSSSGITTMTDATPPRVFIGLQPCRVADTRGNGAPIQGGIFPNGGLRTWDLTGICGIPAGTDAISANFTVTGSPSAPPGAFLLAWPTGGPTPPVSILNFQAGQTVANAAIVPLGAGEQIQVNVSHSTHVILDVNGYFSDLIANQGNYLELDNNYSGFATAFFRNSANTNNSMGVYGLAGPSFPRPVYQSAGVRGEGRFGTLGISQEYGAAGSLVNSVGNEIAFGLLGFHVDLPDPAIVGRDVGAFGYTASSAAGAAGAIGYAATLSGANAGVRGLTGSQSLGAAGVRGQDGGGDVAVLGIGSAGVRGESHAWRGVLGVTHLGYGVLGAVVDPVTQGSFTLGYLGYSTTVGLRVSGDMEVFGNKSFIEPHPTDPSKYIRYTSLEGNEAGTYFRGRARFQNGIAVIDVPEDFRIVTDPEGLSIQVTPIGQMATVAVQSIGLDKIVVNGSRNVEFFFTVNGVRRAYKNYGPVAENEKQFVPMSPEEPMLKSIPAILRERLIANGTYTPDGKVNMETARRLGWDRVWEERSRPAPSPAP